MSNLSLADKQYLENALRLDHGFVLSFTDGTFREFFRQFDIDIDDSKYTTNGTLKSKKMEIFWQLEDNRTVGMVILELAAMFRNKELGQHFNVKFSSEIEKIGQKLIAAPYKNLVQEQSISATIDNNLISIVIRPEIYEHIAPFLHDGHYFTAVEEAYKIVRLKLKDITGSEKATDAFKPENIVNIFGHIPVDQKEKDFYDGVKYLNMAIQFLRNEKAHVPAYQLDQNLAIHYLSLASLAYDLISRGKV